ncbi:MAG: putative Indolepyruvate oxidoreductase subunit IorA [Promethearchaeota archaeon]|nr:MAG: putative Indolepyruvate oxidoreductase subunit IorA [Candidatus Lokiarchaeota archaeon]
MKISNLFDNKAGECFLISGNEAFARGIFEAGAGYAANYPGTPVSEIGDHLKYLSETSSNFTFDYALNEKVAFEACIGASWAGVRSAVMFKHLGLNVAADPLHTFPYSGTNGGMVIICGGDPSILSSTNAQDNRLFSFHTKIPILEPSSIQECKDLTKKAFLLSEQYNVPIYIHVTPRLTHGSGIVKFDKREGRNKSGHFESDHDRYINTLGRARNNQKRYFQKIENISNNHSLQNELSTVRFSIEKEERDDERGNRLGIVTSGISYSYTIQACQKLDIQIPILKLGLIFPLNIDMVIEFIQKYQIKKLLVVEELEPFIERILKEQLYDRKLENKPEIHGKDIIPSVGELNTELVMGFISRFIPRKRTTLFQEVKNKNQALKKIIPTLPIRQPTFCSGCQYRPVFYTLKKVINQIQMEMEYEFIFSGDIGCYTLAEAYPYELLDWVICMGAGIGIPNGMAQVLEKNQKLIAFIGDSTFFHTGIQPFLNAIKNNLDLTIIIFNNYFTAMTGHQEFIGTPKEYINKYGDESSVDKVQVDLISLIKGLNIEHLTITGAYNLDKLDRVFSKTLKEKGTRVIIIQEECALEKERRIKRERKNKKEEPRTEQYYSILDSCVKCNECVETLGCPAINMKFIGDSLDESEKESLYYIDELKCSPEICPGLCQEVCKNNAIVKTIIRNFKLESS